jgi:hypothetical protein
MHVCINNDVWYIRTWVHHFEDHKNIWFFHSCWMRLSPSHWCGEDVERVRVWGQGVFFWIMDGCTCKYTPSLLWSHSLDGPRTGRFSDTFLPELTTCSGVLSHIPSLLQGLTFPGSHYFQTLGVLHASKNVTEGFTKLSYVCVVGSQTFLHSTNAACTFEWAP